MSDERVRTIRLAVNREEWRRKRDARRVLLEKVRARRRLMAIRRRESNADEQ